MNKYLLLLCSILIIMLLASVKLWHIERYNRQQAEIGRDAAINDYQSVSKKYINAQGDSVMRVKAYTLDLKNIRAAANANELQWIKKFEGLKKDFRNLQSATSVGLTFSPEVPHDTVYLPCKDSIKATHFQIKNKWNEIDAMVIGTPKISIRDKVYAVIYSNRPKAWFWKLQWSKREFSSEITNENKLIQLDSLVVLNVLKR